MAHLPSARSHSSRQPSPRQPSPESRPNRDWTYYSPDTGYSRPSDVLFTPPIKRKSRPHAASSSGDVPPNSSARHRSGEHLEPRNQNPGIDIALRDLRHEASKSVNVYEDLVCGFEEQTEALKDWAEESTLDMAWKNKVDKLRSENEASQFAGVIERIASRQESVKSAMERAKQFISSWDERHEIELQIRTAKKAVLYCDGMVDLAKRAAEDRRACGYLVQELKDVKNLLTRKRHPWIYGEECKSADTRLGEKSEGKDRAKKANRPDVHSSGCGRSHTSSGGQDENLAGATGGNGKEGASKSWGSVVENNTGDMGEKVIERSWYDEATED